MCVLWYMCVLIPLFVAIRTGVHVAQQATTASTPERDPYLLRESLDKHPLHCHGVLQFLPGQATSRKSSSAVPTQTNTNKKNTIKCQCLYSQPTVFLWRIDHHHHHHHYRQSVNFSIFQFLVVLVFQCEV